MDRPDGASAQEARQRSVCARHDAPFQACESGEKVGIARNVLTDTLPLHGMRI